MNKPHLKDESFLADLEQAPRDESMLHVWWLGQSGFLLQWNTHRFLFDPYLSDSLSTKYATTDKPHIRMTQRVIAPNQLTGIEVVTSTHNHTDHLDAETLLPLWESNPDMQLVLPKPNLDFAANRLERDADTFTGIADGESTTLGIYEIHGVPAAHEQLDRDENGHCLYMGFVVRIGPWTVYHSGDTIPYNGMEDILRPFGIDLALLPINGRLPERRVTGNLWGDEAVKLASAIGAPMVIPHHFDMFEFNTVTPELFVQTADVMNVPYTVLKNGERLTLHPGDTE